MQTKKVAMVRNSSKALASPKATKTKKKVQEDVDNQENKASQIITSSARKQKHATTRTKNSKENVDATNLNARGASDGDTNASVSLDNDSYLSINAIPMDSEKLKDRDTERGEVFSILG
ncbi:hypothetical protein Tco_0981102 [Tanacetum coccineum]